MNYAIKIVSDAGDILHQFPIQDSAIRNNEINMPEVFAAVNLDPFELMNQGNVIQFGEMISGNFNLMNEFKKWW